MTLAPPIVTMPPDVVEDLRRAPAAFRTAVSIASRTWRGGALEFELPSGGVIAIQGPEPGPSGRLIVRDFRFVARVLTGADIGFGEGYMAGEWDSPDLSALMEAFTLNFDHLEALVNGQPWVRALNFLSHLARPNTKLGSRRNIHAHYDLGNDFYARWLDPSMTYSSARFESPSETLTEGQRNKYAALARQIDLHSDHHVLEIGCGWGGFAEFAAHDIGARVTALTISRAQHEFASRRVFERGLAERVAVRLIDYRDVTGQFDRVASIEMFEAVGEAYWPRYFAKIREVLSPGGRAGIQVITIRDELFKVYRRRSDFMRKYIFPGGMLPSETRLKEETVRAGLEWRSISRFGQNYARTLSEWGQRFESAWEEIRALGFDDRFRRLWRFYLCYCEAAFRTGRTDVAQVTLAKI